MARRRRRADEHVNHERWLISYADFITLLFAFFVVMYSISSVNTGKYRVLSDTLENAFRMDPKASKPIQVGEEVKREEDPAVEDPADKKPAGDVLVERILSEQEKQRLVNIADQVEQSLAAQLEDGMVSITRTDEFIAIGIDSKLLFASASAELEYAALPILTKIARIAKHHPNAIQVEGYTDNVPIQTYIFPSNWELSASRAASVVNYFTELGVDPSRMAAIGYGEYRPIASNDTAEGRGRNRRVSLVIRGKKDATRIIDTRAEIGE